jgi:hypothetical protein
VWIASSPKTIDKTEVRILRDRNEETVPCDSVVLALGAVSDDTVSQAIRDRIKEVYVIGDAQQPRKALDAVHEGFDVGLKL